jgi:predicted dehydrogenase
MVSRRTLLQTALIAPLGGLAAQPPDSASPVRVAFLGASHAHAPAKVQTVRDNPSFQLAGICEQDGALRDKYAAAGIALLTRDQILNDATIPLVVVESDVPDHAADALAALEAGKHIHVEKPPATDMKGLRELLDGAARRHRLVQHGYMWRYHPGIDAMLAAARQGWLGEIFEVRATIHTLVPADQRRDVARFRGGQMFELACHLIDPMVRLLGQSVRVTPFLQRRSAAAGGDTLADNTAAVFEFPRALGIVMSSSVQQNASRQRAFEVFGTNGNAVLRPIEPPVLQIDLKDAAGPYQAGSRSVPMPPYKRYVADFQNLAESVRSQAPLRPLITAEDELRVQQALLSASGMI